MDKDYSIDEMMCVQMARDIEDGDWVNHGAVVPLAGAALMLAKNTHAPNLNFFYLGTVFNSINPSESDLASMLIDPMLAYTSSRALISHHDIVNWTARGGCDIQFLRPLQVDCLGSVNVSVIGDPEKPKARFHGIAVADVMITCRKPVLYVTEHNHRTLVKELSFCTGLGRTENGDWRRRMHACDGPFHIHTPLCVLDFEPVSGRARLHRLNPGVSVEEVIAKTGFELLLPDETQESSPPTTEELRVLREIVDPHATRQLEFKETRVAANERIEQLKRARAERA